MSDVPSGSLPSESRPERSSGGKLPRLAALRRRSQLDFDLAFYGQILAREPNFVDVLRIQGELLTRKGRNEAALEIDRRLARLVPCDPIVHYNRACSEALVGNTLEALGALRRALELGYDDPEHLEKDADLDSLRAEAGFLELLREFGAAR